MEKSLLMEQCVMAEGLSDQLENDIDDQMQDTSLERQLTEIKSSSPLLNESHNDSKHISEEHTHADENGRRIVRESSGDQESGHRVSEAVPPMALESNESSFICKYPGCHYQTVDAELYLKHEDTHVDIGAISCEVCGVTFRTYAAMRRHQLCVHQGIRTFECQYCTKRFLRKEQFVEHIAKHTKPRPYHCQLCGETFNFRGHLKTHVSTEHAGIVVGKTCHLCNFKASSPNAIKVHFATFHLKQNIENSNPEADRKRDLCENSRNPISRGNENGAIDLAKVSQNFSYMASHYPPYSMSNVDNAMMVAGPSDLSCRSKVILHVNSPTSKVGMIAAKTNEPNPVVPMKMDNRHTCVTSQAGSTVVSPPMCQDSSCQRIEARMRQRSSIKPEPAELIADDSQHSNVQPTSTMDLSNNDVVETTCGSQEASRSAETLCKRKIHKHSSSDDTSSESHNSPSNRLCDAPPNLRTVHTCYRYRPYEESSSQRCREYTRHTCLSHRHNPERRSRLSDSDVDRSLQNEQSDSEERKIFYNRATSTNNSLIPDVHHYARSNLATTYNNENSTFASIPHSVSNYFGRKNIVIQDIESCTLTCAFCGIVFPDQTLYLLHRSLHSDSSPWKCNLCGKICNDKYDFNSHIISKGHY